MDERKKEMPTAPRFLFCASRIIALPLTAPGEAQGGSGSEHGTIRFDWGHTKLEKSIKTRRVCIEEEVGNMSLKFSGKVELYVFMKMDEVNVGT